VKGADGFYAPKYKVNTFDRHKTMIVLKDRELKEKKAAEVAAREAGPDCLLIVYLYDLAASSSLAWHGCLLAVYRCTRAHSPHPPPRPTTRRPLTVCLECIYTRSPHPPPLPDTSPDTPS